MKQGVLLFAASLVLGWAGISHALPEGDVATGEELANQYCAACHGAGGVGMALNPPLAGMSEETFVRTMRMFKAGERESATMGVLSANMTDEQFVHLAAYYASLEPVAAELHIEGPLHHISASVCQGCHEDIYEQWSGSMHAKSTALRDPIHELLYRQEVGDPREEGQVHQRSQRFPVCLQCHAPNAAADKVTKLDAKDAYAEGVNCVACHQISGYKGVRQPEGGLRLGILAYETSDQLQAATGFPFDKLQEPGNSSNPHLPTGTLDAFGQAVPAALPLDANPRMLRSSELCLGCHHLRPNPQGVPLCATGDEIEASGAQVTCQSCHMPVADGFANHSMGGGHDPAMLARAVVLTVDVQPNGDGVRADVVMQNQLPHKMPTGAPFRNIQVRVTALDATGNVLWQNFETHAQEEAPEAYLFYQLADDEGKAAMPPVATQVGRDSRLEPHERRVISYDIPVQPAVVRAEMLYNLVFEGMKPRIMELTDDEELLESRRMAFYEARL
ncbi:Cytochrome c family protein [Thioalkalivibrio nitratireducens DSM 14787]|uniref:Cytochrome c family protein n=1 Tax=Thioalkalivibrio nitratireducens (strain DSM 14787 / UNIQEM 213 / ALEN2) TaxID=1255043 RepID=L0DZ73_THIND|nr:multiheme c-type cytochrome [Thioalkalivibrio nitratireducens]AGA33681.1 Cytochrome c family protein [Thioalkalivibrio nitratireducens DSM 14787]